MVFHKKARTGIRSLYIGLLFLGAAMLPGCSSNENSNLISLSGEWQFKMDSLDVGVNEVWYTRDFDDSIRLPGSMMEHDKGFEPTLQTQWTGSIYDSLFYYDERYEKCRKKTPKWGMAACQYWALSKKQYHGSYSSETWQAISGIMRTGNSLEEIQVPALILKADADAEARKEHKEAVSVMQNGRLVHIDGAGHNLQHDELRATLEVLTEFLSDL